MVTIDSQILHAKYYTIALVDSYLFYIYKSYAVNKYNYFNAVPTYAHTWTSSLNLTTKSAAKIGHSIFDMQNY